LCPFKREDTLVLVGITIGHFHCTRLPMVYGEGLRAGTN
jgi:hypothetical protein